MAELVKLSDFVLAVRDILEPHTHLTVTNQAPSPVDVPPVKKRGRAKAAPVAEVKVSPVREVMTAAVADIDALLLINRSGYGTFNALPHGAVPAHDIFTTVSEKVTEVPLDFRKLPPLDSVIDSKDPFRTALLEARVVYERANGSAFYTYMSALMHVWSTSGTVEQIRTHGLESIILDAFNRASWKVGTRTSKPRFFYNGQSAEYASVEFRGLSECRGGRGNVDPIIMNHLGHLLSQYFETPPSVLSRDLVDMMTVYTIIDGGINDDRVLGAMLYRHLITSRPYDVGYPDPIDVVRAVL